MVQCGQRGLVLRGQHALGEHPLLGGKLPTAGEYCVFVGQKKVGEFPEDAAEHLVQKYLNVVDRPRNPYWKPACRDYGDDVQLQIAYLRDQLGD